MALGEKEMLLMFTPARRDSHHYRRWNASQSSVYKLLIIYHIKLLKLIPLHNPSSVTFGNS